MTAAALIDTVRRLGIELIVEGATVRVRGPRDCLSPSLIESLRQHKHELRSLLELETLIARNAPGRCPCCTVWWVPGSPGCWMFTAPDFDLSTFLPGSTLLARGRPEACTCADRIPGG